MAKPRLEFDDPVEVSHHDVDDLIALDRPPE